MKRFIIGEEKGRKCVYFPDFMDGPESVRRWVEKDKIGNEYFTVPNFKNPDEHYMFWGHQLKEMFDSVMEGNGDAVGGWHPTGVPSVFSSQGVVHFLDRSYGEMIRANFLRQAERAVFGYLFYFHNNVSMGPGMQYDKNGEAVFMPRKPVQYMYTLEEARACKQAIVERVNVAVASYRHWIETTPKEIRDGQWERKEVDVMDWFPVFHNDLLDSDLFMAARYKDDKGVHHDNFLGGKRLKIMSAILPERGQWLIQTTFGNRVAYFDSQYRRISETKLSLAPCIDIDFFHTDELASLGEDRVTSELFHVIHNWFEARQETKWIRITSKDIWVHVADYLRDYPKHIGVTCNGEPIWEKSLCYAKFKS